MFNKSLLPGLVIALFALGAPIPAHAQFAVIDVASLGQLIQQVSTLEQQVATARSQLSQAQSEYAAITGSRGMEQLLSGTVRNYLPTDWAQLSEVMSGAPGRFPALATDFRSLVSSNAVLTPAQVALLSPTQQAQLSSRASVAGNAAGHRPGGARHLERPVRLASAIDHCDRRGEGSESIAGFECADCGRAGHAPKRTDQAPGPLSSRAVARVVPRAART